MIDAEDSCDCEQQHRGERDGADDGGDDIEEGGLQTLRRTAVSAQDQQPDQRETGDEE